LNRPFPRLLASQYLAVELAGPRHVPVQQCPSLRPQRTVSLARAVIRDERWKHRAGLLPSESARLCSTHGEDCGRQRASRNERRADDDEDRRAEQEQDPEQAKGNTLSRLVLSCESQPGRPRADGGPGNAGLSQPLPCSTAFGVGAGTFSVELGGAAAGERLSTSSMTTGRSDRAAGATSGRDKRRPARAVRPADAENREAGSRQRRDPKRDADGDEFGGARLGSAVARGHREAFRRAVWMPKGFERVARFDRSADVCNSRFVTSRDSRTPNTRPEDPRDGRPLAPTRHARCRCRCRRQSRPLAARHDALALAWLHWQRQRAASPSPLAASARIADAAFRRASSRSSHRG